MAVGFIVGLAVPSTGVEDQRLGPISDDVKQTAQEAASEQADEMGSSGDGGSGESGSTESEQAEAQATAPGVA